MSAKRSEAAKKGVATRAAKRVAELQAEAVVEGGKVAVDLGLSKTAARISEQLMGKPSLCYKVASLLEEDLLESMLLGSADAQTSDQSPRIRFRVSCKKFKNLPDYIVKTTCESMQPLFNSMYEEGQCGDSKLLFLCHALGVDLDTWLPSHYMEEAWFQDTFVALCIRRYLALGSRLSTMPKSVKLWDLRAEKGTIVLVMCGMSVEFEIPSAPRPVPHDGRIDNLFSLAAKFVCPSAFVTVPLLEVVRGLPEEVLGAMRTHLIDPSDPWEKDMPGSKRCRDEAPAAGSSMEDQITPPSKSSRISVVQSGVANEQPAGASRIERKSSFSQSIFSNLKGSGKAPAMKPPAT
eukprot:6478602-Amphidinium_carterae.1